MDAARIASLLAPFLNVSETLSIADFSHISTYIDILLRWNSKINLTAVRDPDEIVTRHFGESLFAARHLFPDRNSGSIARDASPFPDQHNGPLDNSGRAALQGRVNASCESRALAPAAVADVGSGAGFPGIPIKLWVPHIHLSLIESNHKKATFLREIARALILKDINIPTCRAEILPPARFDLVTLRAVERFETILPTAAALVRPGGRLALLIGSAQASRAQSALMDFHCSSPIPIPTSRTRILLTARRNEP